MPGPGDPRDERQYRRPIVQECDAHAGTADRRSDGLDPRLADPFIAPAPAADGVSRYRRASRNVQGWLARRFCRGRVHGADPGRTRRSHSVPGGATWQTECGVNGVAGENRVYVDDGFLEAESIGDPFAAGIAAWADGFTISGGAGTGTATVSAVLTGRFDPKDDPSFGGNGNCCLWVASRTRMGEPLYLANLSGGVANDRGILNAMNPVRFGSTAPSGASIETESQTVYASAIVPGPATSALLARGLPGLVAARGRDGTCMSTANRCWGGTSGIRSTCLRHTTRRKDGTVHRHWPLVRSAGNPATNGPIAGCSASRWSCGSGIRPTCPAAACPPAGSRHRPCGDPSLPLTLRAGRAAAPRCPR